LLSRWSLATDGLSPEGTAMLVTRDSRRARRRGAHRAGRDAAVGLGRAVGDRRQHPVCRYDEPGRRRPGPPGGSGRERAVVGPGPRRRPGRQRHRRRRLGQRRRPRHRRTPWPADQLLGVLPLRPAGDPDNSGQVGSVPVAALPVREDADVRPGWDRPISCALPGTAVTLIMLLSWSHLERKALHGRVVTGRSFTCALCRLLQSASAV
jgi:hypothetical protein